jgi:hypothetical protein
MKHFTIVAAAMAAAVSLGGATAQAAIAIGDTIDITYHFPDSSTVYQDNQTTFAGDGTTLPIIYTGTATFDSNLITLTQNAGWSYTPAAFNGVQLSDLTNPGAFAGWGVRPSSTMTGFSESASGGSLYVNWEGVTTFDGATVVLGPGVPEPATWAMMLLGVGAIGAVARRQRRMALA